MVSIKCGISIKKKRDLAAIEFGISVLVYPITFGVSPSGTSIGQVQYICDRLPVGSLRVNPI